MSRPQRLLRQSGLTIIDVVISLGIIATVAAVAVPAVTNILDAMRLNMSVRDVERELQYARLTAVSTNRPIRVRLNCPSVPVTVPPTPPKFRAVELIGSISAPDPNDTLTGATANSRCLDDAAHYPYSPTGAAAGKKRLVPPNNDGPIRQLQTGTVFTAAMNPITLVGSGNVIPALEFRPDGTVYINLSVGFVKVWNQLPSDATITLTRKGLSKNIKVTKVGKIQMDR